MNQDRARVISVEDGYAWVEISRREAACGNCQNSTNCETGLLDGSGAARRYRVPNGIDARIGDTVQLHVADEIFLHASFVSYLLPAILAIAGAAVGQFSAADLGAVLGAFFGLALGLLFLRLAENRGNSAEPMLSIRRHSIS